MTDVALNQRQLELAACGLRREGLEIYKVADQLGITRSKAYRILRRHGLNHRLDEYGGGMKTLGPGSAKKPRYAPTPETSRVMRLNSLWRIPETVEKGAW